ARNRRSRPAAAMFRAPGRCGNTSSARPDGWPAHAPAPVPRPSALSRAAASCVIRQLKRPRASALQPANMSTQKPTILAAPFLAIGLMPAAADPVADFYKGKTITIITSTGSGGPFDATARLVARHMYKYIPGQPTMIVRNMPGGGH